MFHNQSVLLKNSRMSLRYRQSGAMLVVAVFVVLVMLLIGTVITNVLSSSSRATAWEVYGVRAFNAANSAAEIGMNRIFPPAGGGAGCANAFFQPAGSATPSVNFTSVAGFYGCSAVVSCQQFTVAETGYTHYRVESEASCIAGNFTTQRTVAIEARER